MRRAVLFIGLGWASIAGANPADTNIDDCDGDGATVEDGDCDDQNADVFPDAVEACNNLDDNCNDEIDEGCDGDNALADATIIGGSTCPSGGSAWLVLFPLLGWGRRERHT